MYRSFFSFIESELGTMNLQWRSQVSKRGKCKSIKEKCLFYKFTFTPLEYIRICKKKNPPPNVLWLRHCQYQYALKESREKIISIPVNRTSPVPKTICSLLAEKSVSPLGPVMLKDGAVTVILLLSVLRNRFTNTRY